jgi:hypothetical protein
MLENRLRNQPLLFSYIIGHFVVDFACAFLLYRVVQDSVLWYLCMLIYNFCAFALQMPIGLLADKWNRNAICAALGCILVVLAYGIGNLSVVMVVTLAGLGNALFHLGGGIDVLNESQHKTSLLGLFVAPGAFGIYLGTLYGKQDDLAKGLVVSLLLILIIVILFTGFHSKKLASSNNSPVTFRGNISFGIILALICLVVVVCLRSYTGMISNFSWKSHGNWGILVVFAVVFGKVAGGFLADWLGAKKASVLSLGLATMFYLFSGYPIFGTAAVFFFNMTMPITLWAVARILKNTKGFAFGLLTFGLYIGFLPVYLNWKPAHVTGFELAVAALCSMVLLMFGLRKAVE